MTTSKKDSVSPLAPFGERVRVRGTGQHRCEKLPSPRPSPWKGEGDEVRGDINDALPYRSLAAKLR